MAANTDKFKKLARKWVGSIGAGGVADGTVTTIPLSSSSGLPTDTAVVATIDRVDANGVATPSLEESVVGVVSGDNLVTCTRGAEGTAQAHSAGAVVEVLFTNKVWGDLIDGILAEHSQAGAHTTDTISEKTADAGVTVDGVKLKDSIPYVDTISEKTTASGVTVDGILLKDSLLTSGILGYSHTRFYIGSFTRDLTAAAGNVSYTGVGFSPKQIIFLGIINATTTFTIGFGNATANRSVSQDQAGNMTYDELCLRIYQASGAVQGATISSLDSDGFTLTWSKVGSPTGTAQFYYLAFR